MEPERLKAAKKGKRKYVGNPCRVCGATNRFVSNGNCVACAVNHTRKYRERIRQLMDEAKESAA